jgi:hypothetical protein
MDCSWAFEAYMDYSWAFEAYTDYSWASEAYTDCPLASEAYMDYSLASEAYTDCSLASETCTDCPGVVLAYKVQALVQVCIELGLVQELELGKAVELAQDMVEEQVQECTKSVRNNNEQAIVHRVFCVTLICTQSAPVN